MARIAILYICTGKYTVFWPNFFQSAETYLLPGFEKHYFVFTDAGSLEGSETERVHLIRQEALEWPYPTLYRFRFFNRIREQLQQYDYCYFFNSNCRIVQPITATAFLPDGNELVVTNHPYYWNKKNKKFAYERNPQSAAYVPMGQGTVYAAGGLNGGKTASYLNFIDTCLEYLQQDESNNIIPVWHDESYLNRYLQDHPYKLLHAGYLYPAETTLPFEKMIHLEDKVLFLEGYGKYAAAPAPKKSWFRRLFGKKN